MSDKQYKIPATVDFCSDSVTVTAEVDKALITVRVTNESESAYRTAFEWIIHVLCSANFPDSYAVEYSGPTLRFLAIPHLPKAGINQLCASAAAYPNLLPVLKKYAECAIAEHCLYTNLTGSDRTMPGGFAVYALGMADFDCEGLIIDYLCLLDGDGLKAPQTNNKDFVLAYIRRYGFTPRALRYFFTSLINIDDFYEPGFAQLIATEESIAALCALIYQDENSLPFISPRGLRFIFGPTIEADPAQFIASAEPALRSGYQQIVDHYEKWSAVLS
ncbi:hypothetical protein CMUST_10175 [Corynebacterium mustelae]|uniref:Uncharacterized protein n=1 Tax=Corynebacterium mustelae TaxID=571915 RepID=A0A0G3GYW5_9CORY|nr:DUF6138 family protein [Corynebacterium mustelae]AKK06351.1 hypothetical protein CMUST_10175 [Corynebacterium mustelae]